MKGAIWKAFSDSARTASDFYHANHEVMCEVVELLVGRFRGGNKLLLFGNGGSAADAQHVAAEFVNRMRRNRRALPAVALTTDSSVLTSVANDHDYRQVFARQVEALGRVDDVVFAFSTSGASASVTEGVAAAARLGLTTVGFTGEGGRQFARGCDYALVVPGTDTPRIQECHILAAHVICELVEQQFAGQGEKA